jgi:hypothetical protein
MLWKNIKDMTPKDAAIKYDNWATERIMNRKLERFAVSEQLFFVGLQRLLQSSVFQHTILEHSSKLLYFAHLGVTLFSMIAQGIILSGNHSTSRKETP